MLQVIKISCNGELLGYLHSNDSMESARMQLFSLVQDLLQCDRVAARINSKRVLKRMTKLFVFLKNRNVVN